MQYDLESIISEIKSRGITGYKIAEETGLTEVGVNKILNGQSKNPRVSTLEILHNYLRNKTNSREISLTNTHTKGVPYYDIEFTSSYLEVENDQTLIPNSYISHPFFVGCDMVVRNSGQSMAKLIAHGDAVGLVKVENWRDFFPLGEVYAIVTTNRFRMIKIITSGIDDRHYTLISKPTDSKKEEFPPQQIKKESILQIFKVQASSHLF